ncbi:hypothetical protein ABKN59_009618 [Abortiporus biennis]
MAVRVGGSGAFDFGSPVAVGLSATYFPSDRHSFCIRWRRMQEGSLIFSIASYGVLWFSAMHMHDYPPLATLQMTGPISRSSL